MYRFRIFHKVLLVSSQLSNKLKYQQSTRAMALRTLYKSVNEILEVLDENKKDNDGVQELLAVYDKVAATKQTQPQVEKKYPLIVFEGLDGCGKSTITRKVANKINAELSCTPPKDLHKIRNLFEDDPDLRTAYYQLGNYVAGLQIAQLLQSSPVVLDRFWHSTAAYAIAESVRKDPKIYKMPPTGDNMYTWPVDLLKPDMILFLSVSERIRITRISSRTELTMQEMCLKEDDKFRNNVLLAFQNMVKPEIEFVDANRYPNKIVPEVVTKIKNLFPLVH